MTGTWEKSHDLHLSFLRPWGGEGLWGLGNQEWGKKNGKHGSHGVDQYAWGNWEKKKISKG